MITPPSESTAADSKERRYFKDLASDDSALETENILAMNDESNYDALFLQPISDSPRYFANDNRLKKDTTRIVTTDKGHEIVWNVLDVIGEGRFAKVYKGHTCDASNDHELVAVKISNNDIESIKSLDTESMILGTLNIPHSPEPLGRVPRSFGRVTERNNGNDCSSGLAMEYAQRGSLVDYKENYKMDLGESLICSWCVNLFMALEALHSRGYAHLDIKPHNCLIKEDHHNLLLSDYGSAIKITDCGNDQLPLGTLGYCAPELLTPPHAISSLTACDIYSAGATMYWMMTRRDPFALINRSGVTLMIAIRKGFFTGGNNPWPKSASNDGVYLQKLAEMCLSLDPLLRPTATEALEILKQSHPNR